MLINGRFVIINSLVLFQRDYMYPSCPLSADFLFRLELLWFMLGNRFSRSVYKIMEIRIKRHHGTLLDRQNRRDESFLWSFFFHLAQLFLETDLRGHTDSVMYLRWHPKDEQRLVSTSGQEQNIRFWDARASKNTATLSTPGNNLYIAWNHDGNYVAVGNRQDGTF